MPNAFLLPFWGGKEDSKLYFTEARARIWVGAWTEVESWNAVKGSWNVGRGTTLDFLGLKASLRFLAFGGIFESTPSPLIKE